MRTRPLEAVVPILIGALAWVAVASAAVPYRLGPGARLETGCFPPCMCPVLIQSPLAGTFTLHPAGSDGLFQLYDVADVDWHLAQGTAKVRITGAGRYRVGGELAAQQRMTLDLRVDGGPVRRYDSGLVFGGGGFPVLEVDVALHGFFCLDSVYAVRGAPSVAGVGTGSDPLRLRASPNPFQDRTEIAFTMPAAGPVSAWIVEPTGRRIRTLAAGERHGAGLRSLPWDGRRDDGGLAAPGIYFVVLQAAGRELRGELVRLGPR